jgi:pimeloyl-ACP methyl ester carboxylesterase
VGVSMPRLFLPGFAVRGSLYRPGLPLGWQSLDLPSLGETRGRFQAYRHWLVEELVGAGEPVILAGHSMGAALAITAAAERPDLVERLILFSPAGLPLSKPLTDSFRLLVRQAFEGLFPAREVTAVVAGAIRHPWATHRLAREGHDLDLGEEMGQIQAAGIPTLVVGCDSDTLTTPAICETIAANLGARLEQVVGAGHLWMLGDWPAFSAFLTR